MPLNHNLGEQTTCPIFIDGLDEIENPNEFFRYLCKTSYDSMVCTTRFNVPLEMDFTHTITLQPLTLNQITLLIKKDRIR